MRDIKGIRTDPPYPPSGGRHTVVHGWEGGLPTAASPSSAFGNLAALEGYGGGALVEVTYGVPLAAALGIGYIAAAALAALGVAL